jgi:hypothetical protein
MVIKAVRRHGRVSLTLTLAQVQHYYTIGVVAFDTNRHTICTTKHDEQ